MIGLAAPAAWAASLDPALLPKIQAATFEVVQAKPASDPLSYEKPLPLDLLPFQERNDKYHSIGTAFAIGHGRYVTAGHVLLAGLDSLWGPPALRDGSGHVYAIATIEKFSLRRDFVVFTLAQPPAGDATLAVDSKPALNQVVYAVGNALGTGVVIRDGLYTSNTPEQQDGAWNWMRFSAAASPGNSGGPLLDSDGKVIGVVTMKSANENLNYALPISEVLHAPDHVAQIDRRLPYQFDLFDSQNNDSFKAQFALPLSEADFLARFQSLQQTYEDEQLKKLLTKEPDRVFPQGVGSSRELHTPSSLDNFPALLTRDGTGNWSPSGRPMARVPLADNGVIQIGTVGSSILFRLRKPDSIGDGQLYAEPKRAMDMLLQLGFLRRTVGSEKIKITSLGKPTMDTLHTDRWQRHWQVRMWPMPSANEKVLMLALPVPDGYVGILTGFPADRAHDYLINLEAMTDFFDVAYSGTLAQWQDYLKNTALLPAVFANIRLDIDYGKRFGYASPRLRFDVPQQVQPVSADSLLVLGFSYFNDHAKPVWGVSHLRLWKNKDNDDVARVDLQRLAQPSADLDDNFKSFWRKVEHHEYPYDAVARSENDVMKIDTVADPGNKDPQVLYPVGYAVPGTQTQADMKSKLGLIMKNLQVLEH